LTANCYQKDIKKNTRWLFLDRFGPLLLRRHIPSVVRALNVDLAIDSPELFWKGAGFASPEREWKACAARRWLAALQRFQRKHNLAGLPPEQKLVTAEAVKGKCRQSGQTQEAIRDILFCIKS
jgi:hypothetical protein